MWQKIWKLVVGAVRCCVSLHNAQDDQEHKGKSRIDSRFARTGPKARYACKPGYPKLAVINWESRGSQVRKREHLDGDC